MGAFLDKPKTEKHTEVGAGNGLRYGLSNMQGWRVEMEDAHLATIGLPSGLSDWSVFAVFDGHAGGKVSAYCSENLLDAIVSNEDFNGGRIVVDNSDIRPSLDEIRVGIRTGFLRLDDRLRELPQTKSGEDRSGTTVVFVIISPTHIIFANCGDSRAVLCRAGTVASATADHKPINPIEKERIQSAGGSVMIQRVNGSLAVSRALGDFDYKNVQGRSQCEQLVSPEPEVTVETRTDDEEFVVIACDGIWDVMSNEELCAFIRSRMLLTDDLPTICSLVIDTCLSKGSRDNMSIIIVALKGALQVSEAAKEREAALDARLEARVKAIIELSHPPESAVLQYVMHVLAVEDIEGLPPGGGIWSKRDIIEAAVTRFTNTTPIDQ